MKKTLFFCLLICFLIGTLTGCGSSAPKKESTEIVQAIKVTADASASVVAADAEKQHVLSVEDVIKLPAPPGWTRSGSAVYVVNYQPKDGNKATFILTITDEGASMQQVINR